jgi:uncharacterized protein GlcG (DUF336 family)
MTLQFKLKTRRALLCGWLGSVFLLCACSGGGAGGSAGQVSTGNCSFSISSEPQALSAADAEQIIAQGVQAATTLGARATLSVVDRSGNVLVVYKMAGAADTVTIGTTVGKPAQGLEGLNGIISSELAAVSKAITGAYLSSSGNAFSTRTASYLVQNHFPPGILQTAGGPLFGAQFSQLPCGDLVTRGTTASNGPKRSPLGLAADPGGFPLYKNGQVVGGIGVIADGNYGLDVTPSQQTSGQDEQIAQSALSGFSAPSCIRADQISINGVTLPYSNSDSKVVAVSVTSLSDPLITGLGNLSSVPMYYDSASIGAGVAFGSVASGFVPDPGGFNTLNGYDLVDNSGAIRYPPSASAVSVSGGVAALSAQEVQEILNQALGVANQARAQIRVPVGSAAQVTISVVDSAGNLLGLIRSPDAPVFGVDVSLQKARSAAFFSSQQAVTSLGAAAPVTYLGAAGFPASSAFTLSSLYLSGAKTFFNNPAIFSDGIAFSVRSVANISRPNFPDGIDTNPNGPFSKALSEWSIFNDGLQLDLVYNGFIQSIVDATNMNANCTGTGATGNPGIATLKNGMQIFPGGFPIYRDNVVVGGIGVSGDGVDQDDLISFLGLARAAQVLDTGIGHANSALRVDTLLVQGLHLLYVQCPVAPFNNSTAQSVCDGI